MTSRVDRSRYTEKDICGSGMPTKETSTSEIVVLRSKSNCFSVHFYEISELLDDLFGHNIRGCIRWNFAIFKVGKAGGMLEGSTVGSSYMLPSRCVGVEY
jgi:hypothetical protein